MTPNDNRPGLVIVGSVPPPPFGCSNLNQIILDRSSRSQFRLILIDTTDRREAFNYGRLDIVNVYLALKHLLQLVWTLMTNRVSIVYLTVATVPLAYLRDGLFIAIASAFRKQIVIHSHGRENHIFYQRSGPVLRWFIRTTTRLATRAACEGETVRRLVFEPLLPESMVEAVPNGVADPYGGAERVDSRRDRHPLKVAYVAHMWEPKGYREILHVIPEVIATHPDVVFVFAGRWASDAEKLAAHELVQRLGIESRVRFLGRISDAEKADLLLESDVFAFPTTFWTEGQPLSVLDAMAAGLPIVVSRLGCIPENVPDGTHSLLIDAGDRPALAHALIRLLGDPELRRSIGAANRRRYLTLYRDEVFADGMEQLFRRVHVRGAS